MKEAEPSIREEILGRLSAEQCEVAADRMLLDSAYYEATIVEEERLIADYIRGDLSISDRADFERQCLLREDLRERIAIRRLIRSINQKSASAVPIRQMPQRSAFFQVAWAAAAVLIISSGAAFYFGNQLAAERRIVAGREAEWQRREQALRESVNQLNLEVKQLRASQKLPGLNPLNPGLPNSDPQLMAFVLHPTVRETTAKSEIAVPPRTARVMLQFVIGFDLKFRSYRAAISAPGVATFEQRGLQPIRSGELRVINLPFSVRPGSQFSATLYGRDSAGVEQALEDYSFSFSAP